MPRQTVDVVIKAHDQASAKMGAVARSFGRIRDVALGMLSARVIERVGFQLMSFTKNAIQAASDAEEIGSKFEAVFKEETKAAREFGENLSESVGRSKIEMQSFLSTLQDTFVPLGFARDRAREMSQQMVKLAIDIASFNNTADDTAVRDLQSAIVGNHETMRKYGVIITQTTLDQQLLQMGFKKVTQGATEEQKALARLQIILKGTSDAQGDAERTSNSYANTMKRLEGQVRDLSADLGKMLTPALADMATTLGTVINGFKDVGGESETAALTVMYAWREVALLFAGIVDDIKNMQMWLTAGPFNVPGFMKLAAAAGPTSRSRLEKLFAQTDARKAARSDAAFPELS